MATYADPTIVQLGEHGRLQAGAILALVAGIIGVLGAAGTSIAVYQTHKDTDALNAQVQELKPTFTALQTTATQLTALDQTAKNLHTVFDSQKRWEAILGTIEQRLYKNMAVTAIQANEKGDFSFSAFTPTYTDYAAIFASLTDTAGQSYFSQVRPSILTKATAATQPRPGVPPAGAIIFSFNLTMQPQLLGTTKVLTLQDMTKGKP